jgi:hypothetical protein
MCLSSTDYVSSSLVMSDVCMMSERHAQDRVQETARMSLDACLPIERFIQRVNIVY